MLKSPLSNSKISLELYTKEKANRIGLELSTIGGIREP
jgi:hypothetical protein